MAHMTPISRVHFQFIPHRFFAKELQKREAKKQRHGISLKFLTGQTSVPLQLPKWNDLLCTTGRTDGIIPETRVCVCVFEGGRFMDMTHAPPQRLCVPRAQTWTRMVVVPDNTHTYSVHTAVHTRTLQTRTQAEYTHTLFCLHCDLETLSPCHWKINMPCFFIQLISDWWMEL